MVACCAVALVSAALSTASWAQLGVNKPAVQKRIYSMSDMAADLKTLGRMAKGQVAFDPALAQGAVDEIAQEAGRIPRLFKSYEVEAGSDAKPEIWSNYEDFTARAGALQRVAAGLRVGSQGELPAALNQIGQACKACHQRYRD